MSMPPVLRRQLALTVRAASSVDGLGAVTCLLARTGGPGAGSAPAADHRYRRLDAPANEPAVKG